jgi:type IV pilus assembly protein PilC
MNRGMINMKKQKKLNNSEVAAFCSQLSLLLPAGITPFECIHLMMEDSASNQGKELLTQIEEALRDGESFHEAISRTGVFPDYVVSMILLGEESGNLDIITKKLADYYEQQCAISEAIKNAVSYPLIMICLMLLILVVLLTKILPIFNQVFIQLGSELSGVSRQLMGLGNAVQSISGVLIVAVAIIAILALIICKVPKANSWFQSKLHRFSLTKGFYLDIAYSRFAGALSMITAGGIDIYKGIDLANRLIDNEVMDKKVKQCKEVLLKGGYLHEAMKEAGIFKSQHQRMLQIGFKSGNSEVVFEKISKYYEEATLNRIHRILGAIEPTLVIIFSLMVGLILLSVIMPLIGIMSSIG